MGGGLEQEMRMMGCRWLGTEKETSTGRCGALAALCWVLGSGAPTQHALEYIL